MDDDTQKNPLLAPSAPPLADLPEAAVVCVADAMPSAPPLPVGEVLAVDSPYYYTAEELAHLDRQPLPVEYFDGGEDAAAAPSPLEAAATATPGAAATAALSGGQGVPVVAVARAPSRAVIVRDGRTGVKSCDPLLQKSPEEILLFLQTHNTRPYVAAHVCGYHHETRTRRVTRTDDKGREHHHTETYSERVDDFEYKIDVSEFVYPYGYLYCDDGDGRTVPDHIADYVRDQNLLKTLQMTKVIEGFDFNALGNAIHRHVRSLGWCRELDVDFPVANASVRVYSDNRVSRLWENGCGFCLLHATILPCLALRCYRGDCNRCLCRKAGSSRQACVKSAFRIPYHHAQLFQVSPASVS